MIKINTAFIDPLSEKAKASQRKRINYNFHPQADDLLQRMLHGMEPDTYVRPHKHENPDKVEAFFCLRGSVAVVEFDSEGTIIDHIVLDTTTGNYGCEIPPRTWHSIICIEPDSVVYEVKNGPYIPIEDKDFASWAPEEGDEKAVDFVNQIVEKLHLKKV